MMHIAEGGHWDHFWDSKIKAHIKDNQESFCFQIHKWVSWVISGGNLAKSMIVMGPNLDLSAYVDFQSKKAINITIFIFFSDSYSSHQSYLKMSYVILPQI